MNKRSQRERRPSKRLQLSQKNDSDATLAPIVGDEFFEEALGKDYAATQSSQHGTGGDGFLGTSPKRKGRKSQRGGKMKLGAADEVPVPQGLETLLLNIGDSCRCIELNRFTGAQLKCVARRVAMEDEETYKHQKQPVSKAECISFLCPEHKFDPKEVSVVLDRNSPKDLAAHLGQRARDFFKAHPVEDGFPEEGMSVFLAYVWFLNVHLATTVDAGDAALFHLLVPHLLRDLFVNHHWHLVLGNYRLHQGHAQHAQPLIHNMPAFILLHTSTVMHYIGDHTECGATRRGGACVETYNILHSPSVQTAVLQASTKVTAFIGAYTVADIHVAYPNQATLKAHFDSL